jgi:hypothetical protein
MGRRSLPFHNNLSDEETDYVVEKVREGIEKFGYEGAGNAISRV